MNRHLNILLVDDDDAVEAAVRVAVSQRGCGHRLYVAKNGRLGLEMLRHNDEIPSHDRVVLLDCHMPIMDGLQFLAELRRDEHLSGTPVFMLTNSVDEADRDSAYSLGISGFVSKPASIQGFSQTVESIEEFLQIGPT